MRIRLLLFLTTCTLLLIVAGCSSDNIDNTSNDVHSNTKDNQVENNNNDLEKSDEKEDVATEKDFIENLLEEANKYTDRMLKDEDFTMGIDRFGRYSLRSYTSEEDDEVEVEVYLTSPPVEMEFEKDEEDYDSSHGMKGTLGDVVNGKISFLHYDDNMRTEIKLGEIEIEEAKKKLDALEFRHEDLTENDIKEVLDFDYEDVKFFDNKGSNYDVSEVWIRKGDLNILTVRYRNDEADEFDAIDVSVNAKEFELPKFKEIEHTTTNEGKDVTIADDGLYVEWFWEEDDGYFYRIGGNYGEEDVEKKEYNLEVIDMMIKKFGE